MEHSAARLPFNNHGRPKLQSDKGAHDLYTGSIPNSSLKDVTDRTIDNIVVVQTRLFQPKK